MKRMIKIALIIAVLAVILPTFMSSKRADKWSRQNAEKHYKFLTKAIEQSMRNGVPYERYAQDIYNLSIAEGWLTHSCGVLADCFLGEQERENEEEIKLCFEVAFVVFIILLCSAVFYYLSHFIQERG